MKRIGSIVGTLAIFIAGMGFGVTMEYLLSQIQTEKLLQQQAIANHSRGMNEGALRQWRADSFLIGAKDRFMLQLMEENERKRKDSERSKAGQANTEDIDSWVTH